MSRMTWRDVVVDVFALALLFVAVLLHVWDMRSAAPWMVAIVAGRWGASSMAKLALARAEGAVSSRRVGPAERRRAASEPPVKVSAGALPLASDPALVSGTYNVIEGEEADVPEAEKKPLPSSAIVLVLFALGGLAWRVWSRGSHGA